MTDIKKGMKFSSKLFSAKAEVSAIREEANHVDIIFSPSDGHDWVEKDMDLQQLKDCFQRADHIKTDPREDERIQNDKKYTVW